MDEKDIAILNERLQQVKLLSDIVEARVKTIEVLYTSMDKSLALYEVGLDSTKEWVKELEGKIAEIEEGREARNRYWLSVLLSIGALATAIIALIMKMIGG